MKYYFYRCLFFLFLSPFLLFPRRLRLWAIAGKAVPPWTPRLLDRPTTDIRGGCATSEKEEKKRGKETKNNILPPFSLL